MTSEKKTIWEIAAELSASQTKEDEPNGKSSLVVVGSKQGGKTSLIYRFIDKNDSPKPTLALEYMFARKQRSDGTRKDVCNVWELGGGVLFTNLIEFALNEHNLHSTSVVVVIDLSAPEELVITTETLLTSTREHISKIVSKSNDKSLEQRLKDKSKERIGRQHEDIQQLNVFPIPLVIVGTKYDIFQDFDPEKKKLIVRYLRVMSHSIGSQLMFVSTKSEVLMNKCRNVLNLLTFETSMDSSGIQTDYTKPVLIPFGSDSFNKIGFESIDTIKRTMTSVIPQQVTELVIPDDPAKDINFKEREIDIIRAQKDRELQDFKRQLEIKFDSKFKLLP